MRVSRNNPFPSEDLDLTARASAELLPAPSPTHAWDEFAAGHTRARHADRPSVHRRENQVLLRQRSGQIAGSARFRVPSAGYRLPSTVCLLPPPSNPYRLLASSSSAMIAVRLKWRAQPSGVELNPVSLMSRSGLQSSSVLTKSISPRQTASCRGVVFH